MIIAVAGNIASGKSTLSRKICSMYGFSYVPAQRSELPFLEDYLTDADRHFFAMQSAYLLNKVMQIEDEARRRNSIVVDRSLLEDIEIFADYWMEARAIDERERATYARLVDYIRRHTPRLDVFIFCRCDRALLDRRMPARMRKEFETKYPPNYLEALSARYESFSYPDYPAVVVELDSGALDFRDDATIVHIMDEIAGYLDYVNAGRQLSLFDDLAEPRELSYIKVIERTEKAKI